MQSRSNCPAAAAQAAAAQASVRTGMTTSTDARRLLFRSVFDSVLSDDFWEDFFCGKFQSFRRRLRSFRVRMKRYVCT